MFVSEWARKLETTTKPRRQKAIREAMAARSPKWPVLRNSEDLTLSAPSRKKEPEGVLTEASVLKEIDAVVSRVVHDVLNHELLVAEAESRKTVLRKAGTA